MRLYEENSIWKAKIVGIEINCDGAVLSSSNRQSATMLRVRFVNIRGRSEKWNDVCIVPTSRDFGEILSKAKTERSKLQLFQRYLFVAWRDLIKASASGFMFKGTTLLPIILLAVADQPQERQFFTLKHVGSFRDCSLCLIISSIGKRADCLRNFSFRRGGRKGESGLE